MIVVYYQLFIAATIAASAFIASRFTLYVCFFWTVFTLVNLFYPPLIVIQLGVVWGSYWLFRRRTGQAKSPHKQLPVPTSLPDNLRDRAVRATKGPAISKVNKKQNQVLLIAASIGVLALFVAGGVSVFMRMDHGPREVGSPPVAAVSDAQDSLSTEYMASAPAPVDLQLEIVAVRQGWLEVRGADGTIFLSRTMAEGESYHPRLKSGWTVSASNGGAFEWRAGGLTVGALGQEGAEVVSVSVDEQLVRSEEVLEQIATANGNAIR